MRIWNKLKKSLILKGNFILLKGKSTSAEDSTKIMDELQNRLRKSNDAVNKIISES